MVVDLHGVTATWELKFILDLGNDTRKWSKQEVCLIAAPLSWQFKDFIKTHISFKAEVCTEEKDFEHLLSTVVLQLGDSITLCLWTAPEYN